MNNSRGKLKRINIVISNNIYILSTALRLCPLRVIMDIIVNIMTKLIGFYFLILIEMLINGLENNKSFSYLVVLVMLNSILLLVVGAVQNIYNEKLKLIYDQTLIEKMNILIFQKAVKADISCYEDADFYDNYTKAASEANGRVLKVIDISSNIISGFLVALCYLIKLATINYVSVIIILMPVLATIVMGKRLNEYDYKLNMSNVLHNRKKEYVKRTVYLQKYAKEMRLYQIFDVMVDLYNVSVNNIIKNIKKYSYPMMFYRLFQRLLAGSLPTIGFMIYQLYKSIQEPVSISDFTVLFYGVLALSSAMEILLNNIITLQSTSLYIDNLMHFMNHVPSINNDVNAVEIPQKIMSIEFVNVSFFYPNSNRPVLKDINLVLNINKKEKISVVGHNGSGKSTLVKLILRFYEPTSGEILLNGQNIKKYNLAEYRNIFGTVFQDFNMFSMTVAENILMRDYTPQDKELVDMALQKSGIQDKVESYKNGIHTMLTREFDDEGEVLSGGQNQKIAIGRAFATDSHILIMDEPSSALDPIAENMIWESMLEVCKEKGTIFISHRLSASKLADSIYMLEDGYIIEKGSHEHLMNLNGKYANMFHKQAINYQ